MSSAIEYASEAQSFFMTPFVLGLVIYFSNETEIPKGYSIRSNDLYYYLLFSIIIILPNLAIEVVLLHVIEVLHGHKMYDFFTYCDFRFRSRRRKWIGMQELDRSIVPAYRSLDNMCFSS